jgi:hypothetical protein
MARMRLLCPPTQWGPWTPRKTFYSPSGSWQVISKTKTNMKQIKAYLFIFVLSFLVFFTCWAEQQQKVQRDFGFGAMEIFQFKFDTALLSVYDINSDGLDDILFLNNKDSRMEVLVRKKSTGDSAADQSGSGSTTFPRLNERFINRGFVLDQWARSFRAADVNGDKRPDILSIGDRLGLVIHFQQADGSFGEPVNRYLKDAASLVNIEIADLNGDTQADVLLCRKENAEILWNDGNGRFKTSTLLDFSAGGCGGGQVADIDSDNKQDLLFYLGSDISSLRVRPGTGNGEFGWEETLPIPALRSLRTVNLDMELQPALKPAENRDSQLAVILQNGLVLRLYGFKRENQGHLMEQMTVQTQRLPLTGIDRKTTPSWAAADFNNDGYSDFCVAAPLLSQVHFYMGGPSGLHPIPQAVDSLTSIKTIKQTQDGDLVVFSAAEKAIALHANKNLAGFPQFFNAPGKPIAMDVGYPNTVFGIFKDQGNHRLHLFDARKPGAGPVQGYELAIANAPEEINVFSLPGKSHWLVMLFMAYDRPVVYRLRDDKLSPMGPENFRAMSLTLNAAAVTDVSSLPGADSRNLELIVSEDKVARLYRWKNEKFEVKRQLNPGRESAKLSAATLFQEREKRPGYLVYDELGQDLIWFSASGSGRKNALPVHFSGGLKDIVGLAPLQLKNRQGLLLIGRSEIQWYLEGAESLKLKTLSEYTSRMEKPSLWAVFPVTLGSPGRNMLAVLDSNNRSVELVGLRDQKLVEELVFEVFQDPGFNEPLESYEPHSIGTGDFNGDHIRDMAVLVHDKLIIYLGE